VSSWAGWFEGPNRKRGGKKEGGKKKKKKKLKADSV